MLVHSMMQRFARLPLVAAVCLVAVVLRVTPSAASEPEQPRTEKRVLIIGVDGMRPDALAKAETPHFDSLIEQGAFTDTGTILGERYRRNDTISGPCWSSILTGVWADKHGVHDNSFRGSNYDRYPHFFTRIKQAMPEAVTVSMVSWEPIDRHLVSGADIRHVERLPGSGTTDLNVSAGGVNTRDGEWHHLAGVRRGERVLLYLNGRQVGETRDSAGKFQLAGDYLYIGRDTRGDATRFNGRLAGVRLWSRALGEAELAAAARGREEAALSREGLLADFCWETAEGEAVEAGRPAARFDNRAGEFTAEMFAESGDPPQTVADAPAPLRDTRRSRHSLELNQGRAAQGARVALEDAAALADLPRGDFTLECWFKTTDDGRNILLGNYAPDRGAVNLELHTGNRVRLFVQPEESRNRLEREELMDRRMAEQAAIMLQRANPTAMFVYFHQVDATGHTIGFHPDVPGYVQSIANVDVHVGTVLESLRRRPTYDREDWLIIVCTDHGGYGKGHGGGQNNPEILTVPVIVSGPSAERGAIEEQVHLVDVVPTALAHLGIPLDPQWQIDGRPVGLKQPPGE